MANTKVTSGVIKDDAVGADQLASNSVVTASIVDNAITTAKINNDAILTAKISDNAVTNAKLSSNSVDSDQYVDASIDTAHIRDGQITSAKLDTNISVSGELTVGSHLNMGDGDILKMGASDDLQIYHDGSHSYIDELLTGDLRIRSNSAVALLKSSDNADMLVAIPDGAVTLYYAGSAKLATTSSGVDVTGTAVTDGLTATGVIVTEGDAALNDAQIGRLNFTNTNSNASSNPIRASILAGRQNSAWGGYLSLYTSTGTSAATEKVRIGETGNVGIGTDSPSTKLHLGGTAPLDSIIRQDSTTSGTNWEIGEREAGKWQIFEDDNDSIVATFMSTGRLGIGTSSPYHTFDVFGDVIANGQAKSNGLFFDTTSATTGTGGGIALGGYSNGTGGAVYHFGNIQGIKENSTAGNYASAMLFSTRANGATPTERMRIDSSGNFLVNTTSSWGGETTPHIESRGDVAGDYTGLIVSNTNDAAGDSVSVNFGLARDGGLVFGNAGKITVGKEQDWTTTASTVDGFMSFSTMQNESLTERMRIDSSGDVLIGQTSQTGYAFAQKLVVGDGDNNDGITIQSGSTHQGNLAFNHSDGTTAHGRISYQHGTNYMQFFTNNTERLRIDSSGVLLVGKTAKDNLATTGFEIHGSGGLQQTRDSAFVAAFNRLTTDGDILEFHQNTVKRGSISISGANTSYNTTSDARLKDVTGEARGLEIVNKLNPVSYNWKHDGKADEGLIAQEVQEIVPNAVSGSEEEHYQMDYSKLVTPLIKAIQEQQEQIETLKQEIQELKG